MMFPYKLSQFGNESPLAALLWIELHRHPRVKSPKSTPVVHIEIVHIEIAGMYECSSP
jgi:hypothetical protein